MGFLLLSELSTVSSSVNRALAADRALDAILPTSYKNETGVCGCDLQALVPGNSDSNPLSSV